MQHFFILRMLCSTFYLYKNYKNEKEGCFNEILNLENVQKIYSIIFCINLFISYGFIKVLYVQFNKGKKIRFSLYISFNNMKKKTAHL